MTLSSKAEAVSDEIARLAKKLRTKTVRVHDLSGVGYNNDEDCHRAAELLELLSRRAATSTGARVEVKDWRVKGLVVWARDLEEFWGATHPVGEFAAKVVEILSSLSGEAEPVAWLHKKAALESNGCGLTYMGLRHFCDHPYLPDEMRSRDCACKVDAEAAIRAYVSAIAPSPAITGGEKV